MSWSSCFPARDATSRPACLALPCRSPIISGPSSASIDRGPRQAKGGQARGASEGWMANSQIQAIADWLSDGARSAPRAEDVLAELCPRLVEGGLPLWRVAVFVRTLHPQVMGRRFEWRPDTGIKVREAPFALYETAEFRGSPVAQIYASGAKLRRRLAADDAIDFPVLAELRDESVTDYLALPLVFSDGAIPVATWTTRRPGRFP